MDYECLVHHQAFVIVTFFKNGESIVAPQRLFRVHFNDGRRGAVVCQNTFLKWVRNFRNKYSAQLGQVEDFAQLEQHKIFKWFAPVYCRVLSTF